MVSFCMTATGQTQRWQASNSGLFGGQAIDIYAQGSVVFASVTFNGAFRSLDNGSTWEAVQGLPQNINYSVTLSGTKIGSTSLVFASTDRGLFRSDDNGNKWQAVNAGLLTYNNPNDGEQRFFQGRIFASNSLLGNTLLFVTSGSGIYRSDDQGKTWQESSDGLPKNETIARCAGLGESLIVGTSSSGVFVSTNQGRTWSAMNNGLEYTPQGSREAVQQRAIYNVSPGEGETALVSIQLSSNIYRWDKTQKRWQLCSYQSSSANFTRLGKTIFMANRDFDVMNNGNMFGLESKGIARSNDEGVNVQYSNKGLELEYTGSSSTVVAASEETGMIFAGTLCGIFRSTDGGGTWSPCNNGMNGVEFRDVLLDQDGTTIFATTGDNRIFRSTNRGMSWEAVYVNSATNRAGGAIAPASTIVRHNNSYFAGEINFILRSDDRGATWRHLKSGWVNSRPPNAEVMMSRGEVLLAGGLDGLMRSQDNGVTWKVALNQNWIAHLAQNDRYIFAIQHLSVNGGGVYRSPDNGATWERIVTSGANGFPTNTQYGGIVVSNDTVWVAMNQQGVFRSTDNGSTWQTVSSGLSSKLSTVYRPKAFTSVAGTLYLCCLTPTGEKVFRSQNGGNSWERFDTGLPDVGWAAGIIGDGMNLYLASTSGFYRLQNALTSVSNSPSKTASLLVSPNPMRQHGSLRYRVKEFGNVRISLVNSVGQTIEILQNSPHSAGEYSLLLDATRYASGMYTVRIEAGEKTEQTRIVFVP